MCAHLLRTRTMTEESTQPRKSDECSHITAVYAPDPDKRVEEGERYHTLSDLLHCPRCGALGLRREAACFEASRESGSDIPEVVWGPPANLWDGESDTIVLGRRRFTRDLLEHLGSDELGAACVITRATPTLGTDTGEETVEYTRLEHLLDMDDLAGALGAQLGATVTGIYVSTEPLDETEKP